MHRFDALYEAARAAVPGVELPREVFTQWLDGRDGFDPAHAAELYLACASARADPAATSAFEAAHFGRLVPVLARFGGGMADDVKQELRQKFFAGGDGKGSKLTEYGGRGGLGQWVRAVAVRLALNLHRAEGPNVHEPIEDDFLGTQLTDDPELAHIKGLYRAEFTRASSEALASLDPELQNYLRLYYVDGLGLAELSGLYQVSVPTASRRLAKAREEVLRVTRDRLRERLSVSTDDLESIMRLIQSRLTLGPIPE